MIDKNIKKDIETAVSASKKITASQSRELEIKDPEYLSNLSAIGMSKVAREDIRPPQILLVQQSSDFTNLVDVKGISPKPGDFFHTGKREVLSTFKCYFIFAAKGKYIDKKEDEQGNIIETEKDKYTALGILDDKTLFGMIFKSSALYTLSPLFSVVASQQIPMFSITCTIESKQIEANIQGKKRMWFIPVCRVGQVVDDSYLFDFLLSMARKYDQQADMVAQKIETLEENE